MGSTLEWRGRVPLVRRGPIRRLGVLAGSLVALGVGAVLATGFGLALYAAGWIAPRLTVGIGLLPLLGWVYGWRAQRTRDLAAASDDVEVRATRGRLSIGDRAHPVRAVSYAGEVLEAKSWLGVVDLVVTHDEALAISDALGVPDAGVRTIAVRGPVAALPVIGLGLSFLAPLVVCFSGAVLTFASHLNASARPVFAALLVTSAALTVLAIAPRRIVVGPDALWVTWLGRRTRVSYAELESIVIVRRAIVITVRGRRPWRLPLTWVSLTSPTATLAEAETHAIRAAEGPVMLAGKRSIASVFE